MDTDAEGHRPSVPFQELLAERSGALRHVSRGFQGVHHIILLGQRRSPERHGRIPHELVQRASVWRRFCRGERLAGRERWHGRNMERRDMGRAGGGPGGIQGLSGIWGQYLLHIRGLLRGDGDLRRGNRAFGAGKASAEKGDKAGAYPGTEGSPRDGSPPGCAPSAPLCPLLFPF